MDRSLLHCETKGSNLRKRRRQRRTLTTKYFTERARRLSHVANICLHLVRRKCLKFYSPLARRRWTREFSPMYQKTYNALTPVSSLCLRNIQTQWVAIFPGDDMCVFPPTQTRVCRKRQRREHFPIPLKIEMQRTWETKLKAFVRLCFITFAMSGVVRIRRDETTPWAKNVFGPHSLWLFQIDIDSETYLFCLCNLITFYTTGANFS